MKEEEERKKIYLGFLDIKKAYPSVWWNGLWWKLKELGVVGKMWKAITSFYEKCICSVRIGGEMGDWYEDEVGLRQGCPLSPLLFAIYINDMVTLIKKEGGSVKLGESKISLLMFADDVVLIADSKEGLQRSLDLVWGYSKKWRFKFNMGGGKSEVMIIGRRLEKVRIWLGDEYMKVIMEYQYLGMILMEEGWWNKGRERLVMRGNRVLWKAVGLGMVGGGFSMKLACEMCEIMVRPVWEYAGEVFGGKRWEQVEVLQRRTGRVILGVSSNVANEVIQGELGWWTVKGRLDMLRLVYYGKLANEVRGMLRRYEFINGRNRVKNGKKQGWFIYMKKLLVDLGFEEEWKMGLVGDMKEWKVKVKKVIQDREQINWRKKWWGK